MAKATKAAELLGARDIMLSVQVLQEFYVQATRQAGRFRLNHDEALGLIHAWLRFRVQPVTTSLVLAATRTADRFQISYWDAAILEAARALGCEVVLSEDLDDATDYDGVRVENPFR